MRRIALLLVCTCMAALSAEAKPAGTKTSAKLAAGTWTVLTRPAKWVLRHDSSNPDLGSHAIVIETYDLRRIGPARVARLRWQVDGEESSALSVCRLCSTQVAVTPAGVYFLSDDMDDAAVARALKKSKPSEPDPPRAIKPTRRNHGRYVRNEGTAAAPLYCIGEGPEPGAGECENVCFAEVCFSPTRGIVRLDGYWAPNLDRYEQAAAP